MLKVANALVFAGLLLAAAVTPAAAISIFSTSHAADNRLECEPAGSCGGNTDNVFIINPTEPTWQQTSPFDANAKWISFNAAHGTNGSGPANVPDVVTPNVTIDFDLGPVSTLSTLTLHVWADDTATVRGNNGLGTLFAADPLATYTHCASSGITCDGNGTLITAMLAPNVSDYHIFFDLFQRGGDGTPFGLMFDGTLQPVPEPATMLLLGSVLTAAGVVSRRRSRKAPH
jgi:hypothetical protein